MALLERSGLPRPTTAFKVAGYELDIYWPDLRSAVELDVYATHGGHESFEEDRLLDQRREQLALTASAITATA